jgi:hypothetical protein
MPPKLFKDANEFSLFIETQAVEEDMSCYSVLLNYCDENDIDPDAISKYVNNQLKEKLAVEFAEMGLLKKAPSIYE